ncbi:hypothetical protein CPC16_005321, partial [Podila verticillata]
MNQVKQLEDCGKDAKQMLYMAFKVRLDDVTTDSMSTSSSKKKKDNTGTEALKVDDCIVKWDPSDSVHIAIKAVYKIDHIPIIKVAWSYLPMSLVKIRLAKDYETVIAQMPVEDQTWEKVIEALHKSIKFESVSSKVANIITKMCPECGKTMHMFSDHLLPLMEAANMDDSDCSWLVKPLSCYLSDVGMQATMNKYKSLDNMKSIKEYLEFLHKTPGAIEGNRTDHTAWFLSQFKADI